MKSQMHLKNNCCNRFAQITIVILSLYVVLTIKPLHAEVFSSGSKSKGERHEVLVLGRVSAGPKRHYKAFDNLGKYLVKRLGKHGIKHHEVVLPRSNDEMLSALSEGKIDLICETPFSALLFEEIAHAKILLRQWKSGVPSYRTFFIARKDSSIMNLSDLKGGSIAFEDPGSTSAYYVPYLTVKKEGIDIVPQDKMGSTTNKNTVYYTFVRNEENILFSVIRGITDAGVISNLDWSNTKQAPEGLKRDLKVFYETPNILRSLLLSRSDLSDDLKYSIVEILINMHENKEGQKILDKYFKVSRFDQLNGKAADELKYARKLYTEFGQLNK